MQIIKKRLKNIYMFDGFVGKSSPVLPGLFIVMSVHLISVKVSMTAKDLVRRC